MFFSPIMPVKARRAELCVVCSFWATDPMCSHSPWRPHRGAEERGRKKGERKLCWEPPALPLTQDCCRVNSPCRDKLCKDHCPGTIAGPTSHMPSPRKPQQFLGLVSLQQWDRTGKRARSWAGSLPLHRGVVQLQPSQFQPAICANTSPVPSTFILLRKRLIGIQAQPLLNNPSYDLCDAFVFRHCCQQYPSSGEAADACRFPKVVIVAALPLLKGNKQKLW